MLRCSEIRTRVCGRDMRLRREAFAGGQVNVPVAKALLYGLQTASWNLRFTNFSPALESPITADLCRLPEEHVPLVGPKRPIARQQVFTAETRSRGAGQE